MPSPRAGVVSAGIGRCEVRSGGWCRSGSVVDAAAGMDVTNLVDTLWERVGGWARVVRGTVAASEAREVSGAGRPGRLRFSRR